MSDQEIYQAMSLAHRIRLAAMLRGMLLEDVAKKARISKYTLYHLVRGGAVGQVKTLRAIAEALDVRLGWLLEGEEPVSRGKPVAGTQKTAGAEAPADESPYAVGMPRYRVPPLDLNDADQGHGKRAKHPKRR